MKPTLSVTQTADHAALLRRAMTLLTRQDVLVGIPAEKAARKGDGDGEPAGNALIGYVQEHGSPARNIPARPFLVPGITSVQDQVAGLMADAARAALRGDPAGVVATQNRIGLMAVNAVGAQFVDNDWPALAPQTLAGRWREENRDQVGKKQKKDRVRQPKKTNPLLFTTALRGSIAYVVRGRGL